MGKNIRKIEKERASNIELLRIFSMLFIVVYHFFIYSINSNNPNWNFITTPAISVLHIGVICFVLITGYFGINFSLKGFMKLVIQCSFYSFLIYFVYIIINPEIFSIKSLIKSFIPTQWWFINIYLCLYLLAPIINIPLKTASSSKKAVYIVTLLIISFLFQFVAPSLSDGKNPINFILIYYIGDFIRHNLKFRINLNAPKLFCVYIMFNILLFFTLFFLSDFKMVRRIFVLLTFPYNSIGLIINSILFFLVFHKLQIKSRIINWIAISILPVYLIHENKYVGSYLYPFVNTLQDFIDNPILFILSVGLLGIVVLLLCVYIDKLITPIIKFIENIVFESKFFKRINDNLAVILE